MKSQNGLNNMREHRTIAYHKERGIFVGVLEGYAIFSKNDPTENYEVYGFESLEKAKNFFEQSVPGMRDKILYEKVQCNSEYVSVIDIIKSGNRNLDIAELFMNLPCENEFPC